MFPILSASFAHITVLLNHCWNVRIIEPPYDKTNKKACAPSEDSDQPKHPPSLIRVFAVRMKKVWLLVGFVMRRLSYENIFHVFWCL